MTRHTLLSTSVLYEREKSLQVSSSIRRLQRVVRKRELNLQTSLSEMPLAQLRGRSYRDSKLIGFGLRVAARSAKAFVVETRVDGKVKRMTICRAALFSVDEAKREALRLLRQTITGEPLTLKLRWKQKPRSHTTSCGRFYQALSASRWSAAGSFYEVEKRGYHRDQNH